MLERLQLLLDRVELPFHLRDVVLGDERRDAVLREERGDQGVGISHHRDGDALVDDPVEPEHDGHALPGAHRGQHRRQVADEQLAEELQLLDHLAGGQSARGGHAAVVLAGVEPDGADFAPERTDHLGR